MIVLALLLAAAVPAAAERGWSAHADLVGRVNPSGLIATGSVMRREGPVRLGLAQSVTPAYAQSGLVAELTPHPVFQLRARYDLYSFFGANDGLLSFPDGGAAFGRRERERLSGTEESKLAHRFMLQPSLRVKAGSMLFVQQIDIAAYRFAGRGPYFLELEYDTLLIARDTLFAARSFALYERREWRAGPFYELVAPRSSALKRHRAGLSGTWTLAPSWRGLERPRIYGLIGLNAADRNRSGQLFAILGFGADWEFKR